MQLCSYAVMQLSDECCRDKAMPCLYDFQPLIKKPGNLQPNSLQPNCQY